MTSPHRTKGWRLSSSYALLKFGCNLKTQKLLNLKAQLLEEVFVPMGFGS